METLLCLNNNILGSSVWLIFDGPDSFKRISQTTFSLHHFDFFVTLLKAKRASKTIRKNPSCQTYPVCGAYVHLFHLARAFAPLNMQHAFKFSTQMV